MRERLITPLLCATLASLLFAFSPARARAQVGSGSIIGQVRIAPGNEITAPVMITLTSRGATITSVYTDNEGRFGFNSLPGNVYHVEIHEDGYMPLQEDVAIDPTTATMRVLTLYLVPRETKEKTSGTIKGGNTHLTASAQYTQQIPKAAHKEYEKGVQLEKHSKTDDAIRRYQKAIEIAPQFYEARNNLGSDLLGKSRFPEAEQQFEEVIKMNPSDAAAYFNLGNLFLLTKQFEKGLHSVEQGLSKQPDSAFGHFLQGSLYAQTGQANQAEIALKRCLELDPIMSKAHLALVNLYLQQKRSGDATAELRAFLKAFPEDPFVPQAKQVLEKLTASNPE